MVRRAGLVALLVLTGCVVDVDLGRVPAASAPDARVEPDPPTSPDAAPPRPDAAVAPDAEPPLDAAPDGAPSPDADPAEIASCAACVEQLAAEVDCEAPDDCLPDPLLLEECTLWCDARDDGTCEGCFATLQPLLDACRQFAPEAACHELEFALLLHCEARCGDGSCGACLGGIVADCSADSPLDCADHLARQFGACFGACDDAVIFEGLSCAVDAADAWTLCTQVEPGACDAPLAAEVELCRLLAEHDVFGCMETCTAIGEVRHEICGLLRYDAPLCELRTAAHDAACFARCQGQPWGICEPGGHVRRAVCVSTGGVDCEALGDSITFTCRGEPFGDAACDDCLIRGLFARDACGDFSGCLDVLEGEWASCLQDCGGVGPAPGCLHCALGADRALGDCLASGFEPALCIGERDAAADDCAGLCGDAIARAVPCSVRSEALFDRCTGAPDEVDCNASAILFDAACHWARLGVE